LAEENSSLQDEAGLAQRFLMWRIFDIITISGHSAGKHPVELLLLDNAQKWVREPYSSTPTDSNSPTHNRLFYFFLI
jgi:hypothetical protein